MNADGNDRADGVQVLEEIGNRLVRLARKGPIWLLKETAIPSPLLIELHAEWVVHYLVTWKTLATAVAALTDWYDTPTKDLKFRNDLLYLGIQPLTYTVGLLETSNLRQFFTLAITVIESLANLAGLKPVQDILLLLATMKKLRLLLKSGETEYQKLASLLPAIEKSMEAMLLMSLFADSRVAAITTRSRRPIAECRVPAISKLKQPIVKRLEVMRIEMYAITDFSNQRIAFNPEGCWPIGFRDVDQAEGKRLGDFKDADMSESV